MQKLILSFGLTLLAALLISTFCVEAQTRHQRRNQRLRAEDNCHGASRRWQDSESR